MGKQITEIDIENQLELLENNRRRIESLVNQPLPGDLSKRLHPDEWSAVEIIAHLRACADVWSYSIYAMITLDEPEIPYIHPNDWMKTHQYTELSFAVCYRVFEVNRQSLFNVLCKLNLSAWKRNGTIEGQAHTVYSEVRRLALHEDGHCTQLEAYFEQMANSK